MIRWWVVEGERLAGPFPGKAAACRALEDRGGWGPTADVVAAPDAADARVVWASFGELARVKTTVARLAYALCKPGQSAARTGCTPKRGAQAAIAAARGGGAKKEGSAGEQVDQPRTERLRTAERKKAQKIENKRAKREGRKPRRISREQAAAGARKGRLARLEKKAGGLEKAAAIARKLGKSTRKARKATEHLAGIAAGVARLEALVRYRA